jgi:N-acetyl-anhydromuramyl-L-alanine amidase AmpD
MSGGALVYGVDKKIIVPDADVRTWHDYPKIEMKEPKGVHPRPKDTAITQIVLHWTASERVGQDGAERTVKNMSNRTDAGAHLIVTNEGIVWQTTDLETMFTSHVSHKIVRPKSIGIEVSCYGWLPKGQPIPSPGKDRERYKANFEGWKPTVANYYPAQQAAVNAVVTAMCETFNIPKVVMLEPFGVRSNKELREYEGVLAHMNCALGKNPKKDPGPKPMIALHEHFASLA